MLALLCKYVVPTLFMLTINSLIMSISCEKFFCQP